MKMLSRTARIQNKCLSRHNELKICRIEYSWLAKVVRMFSTILFPAGVTMPIQTTGSANSRRSRKIIILDARNPLFGFVIYRRTLDTFSKSTGKEKFGLGSIYFSSVARVANHHFILSLSHQCQCKCAQVKNIRTENGNFPFAYFPFQLRQLYGRPTIAVDHQLRARPMCNRQPVTANTNEFFALLPKRCQFSPSDFQSQWERTECVRAGATVEIRFSDLVLPL